MVKRKGRGRERGKEEGEREGRRNGARVVKTGFVLSWAFEIP